MSFVSFGFLHAGEQNFFMDFTIGTTRLINGVILTYLISLLDGINIHATDSLIEFIVQSRLVIYSLSHDRLCDTPQKSIFR